MADLISQIKGLDNITYDLQDKISTFGGTNLLTNSKGEFSGTVPTSSYTDFKV